MNRRVYTYTYLLHAAREALKRAESSDEGQLYECMHVLLYSALALEAFLNHMGAMTAKGWAPLKRKLSPREKIDFLLAQADRTVDFGVRPYQSFKEAFKFRNLLVHAETETVTLKNSRSSFSVNDRTYPETSWETFCYLDTARSIHDDIRQIIEQFPGLIGVENIPAFLMSESVGGGS